MAHCCHGNRRRYLGFDAGHTHVLDGNSCFVAVGIVRSTLLNYENGTSLPNVGTLDSLADYYGIPLEWFIGVEPMHDSDRLVMARAELARLERPAARKTPRTGNP